MTEEKIKLLTAKADNIFGKVKETYEFIGQVAIDKSLRSTLLSKVTLVDGYYVRFEETINEIEKLMLSEDENYVPNYTRLDSLEELIGIIKYNASICDTRRGVEKITPEIPKLPTLDLPYFDGNLQNWSIFSETFVSLIHNNKSLSNDQKIQYLVSRLKSTALSVCTGIPPIGDNYETIWTALKDRYEDKRDMAGSYMDTIINFKIIKSESIQLYQNFIDEVGMAVSALKGLKLENLAEYILYALSIRKLDADLCRKFETKILHSNEMPMFSSLLTFVKDELRIMQRIDGQVKEVPKKVPPTNYFSFKPKPTYKPVSLIASEKQKNLCLACKEEVHQLYSCAKFTSLKASERLEFVKSNKLCFNCLSPGHSAISCSNKLNCKKCNYRHHTMLHLDSYSTLQEHDNKNTSLVSSDIPATTSETHVVSSCYSTSKLYSPMENTKSTTVLLSTVKVQIQDQYGNPQVMRMLLDSASMRHFITTSCCNKLGINYKPVSQEIGGIGGIASQAKGVTAFSFCSRFDSRKSFNVTEALVVDKITNKLPICPIDINQLSYLKDFNLSDDTFYVPDKIDGLIGAELFSLLVGKPKQIRNNTPTVIESVLGDIVIGKAPTIKSNKELDFCAFVETPLESVMQKFWTIEEVPSPPHISKEDATCEKLFIESSKRLEDGSYCVSLPFKCDPNTLGNSYDIAKKRLIGLEKRHSSKPEVAKEYVKAMNEYMQENYAHKVDISQVNSPCYFMPHHAVVKPERATSKVRVVFDMSCSSTSGLSLNDLLYTGPTLYNDLFKLLILFRMFPYACTADIRKMFLQIHMHPDDHKFHCFLWRDTPDQDIQCYQMNRVVFGSKPSPYLAQRVLRQLASDEKQLYPQAAKEVEKNFYMDDYLTSFLDEDDAVSTLKQCTSLLSSGGFQLTKFASNNQTVIDSISSPERVAKTNVQWNEHEYMKVLGIEWCPSEDNFKFKVNVDHVVCTKRGILSTIARIYDVLGLISPVTTKAKIIMKELWNLKLEWDDKPPNTICQQWVTLVKEFSLLSEYKIPRHLFIFKNTKLSLVGFCDASEKALGACIYAQVTHLDGNITTQLVCGKSKLTPLRYVSIPRQELCSMMLLSKLMCAVVSMCEEKHNVEQIYCFSDSQVALAWNSSESSRWKVFVANRVAKIQENVSSERWFHVKGSENPADCLSRGLLPSELITHELWSKGPLWLSKPTNEWPLNHTVTINEQTLSEAKPVSHVTVKVFEKDGSGNVLLDLAERSSSWKKLLRSVCYVLKFAKIIKRGKITTQDLNVSELTLLKALQQQEFAVDIKNLQTNKDCSDSFKGIHAFLQDGVVLCGGRISNAAHLDYSQVHPIVLPKKHHIVNLIIDHYHRKNLHTGPHLLISILRNKYWIFSCRDTVRRVLKKCNLCFKHNPKPLSPLMGNLPAARVNESKAFLHTGVDYAGPFNVTISKHRGVKTQKAYLCLFICMATKALHLELASSLSTEIFLAALGRFIARRGLVRVLYSDQGSNFIGARNTLNELYDFLDSTNYKESLEENLLERRIEFKFNPPASPHFGGLWESNIRQVKRHLYKAIGLQILSYEELNTVIIEIEAILNSRPLCQLDADSTAPKALSPAHFLMQEPGYTPMTATPLDLGQRFKLTQQMIQSFWSRWSTEYLTSLQQRTKWLKNVDDLKVGLVVLIKSENTPVLSWPLGKVVQVFPGKDGICRVALVKTSRGLFKRPAVKLCPLPNQ